MEMEILKKAKEITEEARVIEKALGDIVKNSDHINDIVTRAHNTTGLTAIDSNNIALCNKTNLNIAKEILKKI